LTVVEKEELFSLGKKSLLSNDVPVSALIIYDGQIIGKGFNTVLADSNAAGHAEINAITNAVKNLGWENFFNLDREKLLLISTFEPCPMCIGAIQEYKIKHVNFIKEKSIGYWLKNRLGNFLYEQNKRKISSDIQDSLFLLHPAYKSD
jgi:tRNA(Arg) A34 adenosine deaminase TadA